MADDNSVWPGLAACTHHTMQPGQAGSTKQAAIMNEIT